MHSVRSFTSAFTAAFSSAVVRALAVSLSLALAFVAGCSDSPPRKASAAVAPADTLPTWLRARAFAERGIAARSTVLHDFVFSDEREASGITFVHQIVDDVGRHYKANHYDHGSGICAADVDNDGKTDIFFVSQRGTSELWRGTGGGRFENITVSSGVRLDDVIGVGCAFGDIDNDGLSDLFLTTVRHGNRLFRNLGKGAFSDVTDSAGVGYVGHSSGALFFDYDGDGLLDLLVANVGDYTTEEQGAGGYFVGLDDAFHGHTHPERDEASILYRNVGGGRFLDVSKSTGFADKGWSGDATIIDVNEDGRPDVYMLNMMGENHLWLNENGERFRESTASFFPRTPWGAMGAKAFDFNGDSRLDLFVTDMHSDMFDEVAPEDWNGEARKSPAFMAGDDLFPTGRKQFVFGNALFANVGQQSADNRAATSPYREVSDSLGVETYWPWGPSVDDLNADGWDDVLVIGSMNFPYRYGANSLLLNQSGTRFVHAEFTVGLEPRRKVPLMQPWYTLDCSESGGDRGSKSCISCVSPGGAEAGCRREAESGRFTMMSSRGSRSAVILDLDDDGDLDIVTNELNAAPQVLVSSLAAQHTVHALRVRLRGTRSNRPGIGARVTVVLPDGRRVLKVNDGKSGYLGQSDLPLYFGLGAAAQASSIEVRWPSGTTQTVPGPLRAGQLIEIVEQ